MITDMHCHFVPGPFLDFVTRHDEFAIRVAAPQGDDVWARFGSLDVRLNTTFFDLTKQTARMRTLGIQRSVLSLATSFIDYSVPADLACRAARLFNDGLAAAIEGRVDFRGWAFLPLQDPAAAALELRRCVSELGFVGGHVASNVNGLHLHEDMFAPVHRVASELGVPLFVHPADPAGKERMRDYELTIVAGYLFDNTLNLLKLVCSGFLDRWPDAKLVFAHTGAFGLLLRARMQREVDTNPMLSKTLTRSVGEYMRRLYFDTVCFEPAVLRYATSIVPIEHFVMGSDAPFPLGEPEPVDFVRKALPADQAHKVLAENFDRLLA